MSLLCRVWDGGRMFRKIAVVALATAGVLCVSNAKAGIVVTADASTLSAAQMVNTLVGVNPGINVVSGSESYSGAGVATGTFSGGTAILPFDSGLALTSGSVHSIPGPNTVPNASTSNNTAGHPALDALAGFSTHDAAVL